MVIIITMKNVRLRNGIYEFRMAIPADCQDSVGKKEITQSLKTSDGSQADVLAKGLTSDWKAKFKQIRAEEIEQPVIIAKTNDTVADFKLKLNTHLEQHLDDYLVNKTEEELIASSEGCMDCISILQDSTNDCTVDLSDELGITLPLPKQKSPGMTRRLNKAVIDALARIRQEIDTEAGWKISERVEEGVLVEIPKAAEPTVQPVCSQDRSETDIAEITNLLKSFEVELPVEMLPQSLNLSTGVQGNLEQLALQDIKAEVVDNGIKISLLGAVENVLGPTGISADITLNSDSVALFSKYAGTELPDLGPLEAKARVESSGESYRLKSLQANLNAKALQADITASVADLLAVSGIQAEVTANTPTLAALSDIAQTELPDTDPVKVHIKLSGEDLEKAKLVVNAQSAGAKVAVNSLLSQLKAADQLKMDVTVNAETLTNFNKFAQMELPEQGPLDLSASVSIEPGSYSLSALNLQLDDQSATGDLKLSLPAEDDKQGVTLLHGQLDIPYLDLSHYLVSNEPADELTDTPTAPEDLPDSSVSKDEFKKELKDSEKELTVPVAESDRLLSSEPVLDDWLRDYDIDLAVSGKRLNLGKTDLENLQVKVLLKDGLLSIAPIHSDGSDSGTIDGTITIDGRSATPTLDADITMDSIAMPNLGGTADLNLNIDGQGQSVAELMASLNGQLVIAAHDGVIPNSFATKFGNGLMASTSAETTELECFILRVDIVDGIADFKNKLAAQLTSVTWRGGGYVDFNTERLSADIAPKPRKGLGVSIGGSLAGLVKLSGTLKNPVVRPDYSDAAVKYGKYSAYIATGGLTLLAEIIHNKMNANKDVCEQILDGTVFAAADKAEKKNLPK